MSRYRSLITLIGSLHSQGRNSPVDFQKEVIFYEDGAQIPDGDDNGADNGRTVGHDLPHCGWCQNSTCQVHPTHCRIQV